MADPCSTTIEPLEVTHALLKTPDLKKTTLTYTSVGVFHKALGVLVVIRATQLTLRSNTVIPAVITYTTTNLSCSQIAFLIKVTHLWVTITIAPWNNKKNRYSCIVCRYTVTLWQCCFELLTSANIRVCFSTWPPGGVLVKVLTLLTVVPHCVVLANTSTVHL